MAGLGLFFSKQTISSLKSFAWSGNANTVRFFVSSVSRTIDSGSIIKGDFSPVPPSSTGKALLRMKTISALNLPLLVI